MTIGLRLTRAFLFVGLIIALGTGVMMWQFAGVVRDTRRILAIDNRLTEVYDLERDIRVLERDVADESERQDTQALLKQIRAGRTAMTRDMHETLRAFHESGTAAPDTLRAVMTAMQGELDAVERLSEAQDWLAIQLRAKVQMTQVVEEITSVVGEIRSGVSADRIRALEAVDAKRTTAEEMLGATAICSLLASLLLGFHVTRSITRPLHKLQRAAYQLASSDFGIELEANSNDELAAVGRDLMVAARHLETSYSALTRSNQDLERFASAVSHDLREPLRTVATFSELLEREHAAELTGEGVMFLDLIRRAAVDMGRLINGILEYSRLTSSDGQAFEELPLAEVVRMAITNLRVAIEEAGAGVTCDRLPIVRGNRVQLTQLFQNLIGNAIKYARAGIPPKIHISASEGREGWTVGVADNGVGIDSRYQEKVFGVFQQLNRSSGGIGLGLAVAKRIVEQHGGRIWIESDGQTGSRFLFVLPKADGDRGRDVGARSQVIASVG